MLTIPSMAKDGRITSYSNVSFADARAGNGTLVVDDASNPDAAPVQRQSGATRRIVRSFLYFDLRSYANVELDASLPQSLLIYNGGGTTSDADRIYVIGASQGDPLSISDWGNIDRGTHLNAITYNFAYYWTWRTTVFDVTTFVPYFHAARGSIMKIALISLKDWQQGETPDVLEAQMMYGDSELYAPYLLLNAKPRQRSIAIV